MDAIYNGSNSFRVFDNRTSEFTVDRRVKMDCGDDGVKYASVVSSIYASPYTTVLMDESELTASLTEVWYSIMTVGDTGSLPNHTHDGSEGSGGEITVSGGSGATTFLELIDTPSTYSGSEGLYLRVDSTASGIEFSYVATSGIVGRKIYVDYGEPTTIDPVDAVEGDYYIDSFTSNMYERQGGLTTLFSDDFTGSTLDVVEWSTRADPDGSVTQNDVLELNNSGDWCYAHAYTNQTFDKVGLVKITCKWKPHKNLSAAASDLYPPQVIFRDSSGYAPDGVYGYPQAKCFFVRLGKTQVDTTDRSELSIMQDTTAGNSVAISIDETQWHDLVLSVNCDTRLFTIDLDSSTYVLSETISQVVWDSIAAFTIEFGTSDYSKTNTEQFDDVVITTEPPEAWDNLGHTAGTFINLPDTPSTYSGTEGQYLMSTGSGTVWSTVSGTDDHSHAVYVPWDFGAGTISGTGDIYCNDIYTSSGTVYIGELQLSTDGTSLLIDGEAVDTTDAQGTPWYNDTAELTPGIYSYLLDEDTGGISGAIENTDMWLSDWEYRKELTISYTDVSTSGPATHFPVPIVLGSSSGLSDVDTTDVFDVLGVNSQKIAVTIDDGTTELYVEIEHWDESAGEAVLWISKDDFVISNTSDTKLYLYFDNTKSDNITYVGTVGNRTEVWDQYFTLVYHLSQTGAVTDSTSYSNDGAPTSVTYNKPGLLADGVGLSASSKYITTTDHTSIAEDISSNMTFEVNVLHSSFGGWNAIAQKGYDQSYAIRGPGQLLFDTYYTSAGRVSPAFGDTSGSEYKNLVATFDGRFIKTYREAVNMNTVDLTSDTMVVTGDNLTFPKQDSLSYDLDEVRISKIARSAGWITTNHTAINDQLVTFGTTQQFGLITEYLGTIKSSFLDLTDTPSTYSGTDGQYLMSTGSGTVWATVSGGGTTSGTDDHSHVAYVPWDFGAGTISGTGDIYCNDIYTSSGTVYIGDTQLTTNSDNLYVAGEKIASETYVDTVSGSLQSEVDTKATTLLELTDTPGIYETGKFLKSTTNGSAWHDVPAGTLWYNGEGTPSASLGEIDNYYLETISGSVFSKTDVIYSSDQCTGGTPLAESHYSSANVTKAFDDDIGTLWTADQPVSFPTWLQYQFPSSKQIEKLRMNPGIYTNRTPNDFILKASNTGAFSGEETDLLYVNDETSWSANTWQEYTFANGDSYLYYRIHVTSGNWGTTALGTCEVEMMELNSANWELVYVPDVGVTTFSGLSDTPSTYDDGYYLRMTTSGITSVSGIILTAPNDSEWLLQVTNSGTLYTTEVV